MGGKNSKRKEVSFPTMDAIPVLGDNIQLWSLMSHEGDGFISAVRGSTALTGNGTLEDIPAIFKWGRERSSSSDIHVHVPLPHTDRPYIHWTDLEKTHVEGVVFKIDGTKIGIDDHEYYITAHKDTKIIDLTTKATNTSDQTFTMEFWPRSIRVPDAGSYVRFRLNGEKALFLGCNGEGVVSVMEQKEPSNTRFGDNYFPNPGILFYLYDLGSIE